MRWACCGGCAWGIYCAGCHVAFFASRVAGIAQRSGERQVSIYSVSIKERRLAAKGIVLCTLMLLQFLQIAISVATHAEALPEEMVHSVKVRPMCRVEQGPGRSWRQICLMPVRHKQAAACSSA